VTPSILFLLGLLLTLIATFAIVIYLRHPLHRILVELCGTEERAEFWGSFSNVTITLVPLIFAMQYTPELKAGTTPILELAAQFKWALAGLLAAVLILGWVISSFIRRETAPTVSPKPAAAPAA
jgi:hypothetical protein